MNAIASELIIQELQVRQYEWESSLTGRDIEWVFMYTKECSELRKLVTRVALRDDDMYQPIGRFAREEGEVEGFARRCIGDGVH
jgi:hypothetical protein